MEIFIDESGSFVAQGAEKNSWCIVAAFACIQKSKYRKILAKLKCREGVSQLAEIKLNQIPENSYETFLIELYQAGGVLLSVATDSGLNDAKFVKEHQENQKTLLLDNIDEMEYETGKEGIRYL